MSSRKQKVIKISTIIIVVLISMFMLSVLAFNIVYYKTTVKGLSMYPVLNANGANSKDRIFINKYNNGDINDIIVADIENEPNWDHSLDGNYIVKRLIGKSGDKIKIVKIDELNYELQVNERVLYKKNITGMANTYVSFINYVNTNQADTERIDDGSIIVKKGEIFVMGDNWETSYDCATCGPISSKTIVGKVDIIVPKSNNLFWGAIKGLFNLWF